MAKLVLLLVCVALFQTAYSIKCYNCQSKDGSTSCEDLSDKKEINCGENTGGRKVACLKRVWYDTQTKMNNVTRMCLIEADKDAQCKVPSNRYEMKVCEMCTEDYCNTATNNNMGMISILGTVASYVVARLLI